MNSKKSVNAYWISSNSSKPDTILISIAPALLGALVFAGTLRCREFIRDDSFIIAANPLLRSASGLLRLWTTGYWQAVAGSSAAVAEYRPVTMLTFYADLAVFGRSPGAMHLLNIALHAGTCVLARAVLSRRMSARAAWLAALVFAVLPVHVEAVASLVGRAELLAAFWTLAAWALLSPDAEGKAPGGEGAPTTAFGTAVLAPDNTLRGQLSSGDVSEGGAVPEGARRRAFAAAAFGLALFSKEGALVFPAVLLLDDIASVQGGARATLPRRRRWDYGALCAVAGAYLAARLAVLARPFHGGPDYFAGSPPLARWLTVSRFWIERYLWPSLTGLGLANDFSRPMIPDSGPSDVLAWACLLGLAGTIAWAARSLARGRSRWAFWILWPVLFLLPTSNLVVALDTLGAQRFLYIACLPIAVLAGWTFDRWLASDRRIALGALVALLAFWSAATLARASVWSDGLTYYADALAKNPASSGARLGYAMALLRSGDRSSARMFLEEAARLKPHDWAPRFNLARLAWEDGDRPRAEAWLGEALALGPDSSEVLALAGFAAENRKDPAAAEGFYRRALEAHGLEETALRNLGLLFWRQGRPREAAPLLERYLRFFPDAEDAGAVAGLLRGAGQGR